MELRDEIAALMERMAGGWPGEETKVVADAILALPTIARWRAIAKDYDAAKDLGPSV